MLINFHEVLLKGSFLNLKRIGGSFDESLVKGSVKFLTKATCTHQPLEPSPPWSCSSFEYLNQASASPSHLSAASVTGKGKQSIQGCK